MKKGVIGVCQLVWLEGMRRGVGVLDKHLGSKKTDVEGIFCTTAFQAGIDEYFLQGLGNIPQPASEILRSRIRHLPPRRAMKHLKAVMNGFSPYLYSGVEKRQEVADANRPIPIFLD